MRILILYPYFNARYYALYVDGVILNSSMVAPMGQALVTSSALFSDLSRLGIGLFLQESYQTPVTILNLEQTEASLRAVQGQLIKEEN
jgi:hypothetical protein